MTKKDITDRRPSKQKVLAQLKENLALQVSCLLPSGPERLSLNFVHLRQLDDAGNVSPYGGLTVAYATEFPGTDCNVVTLSVALCNPTDTFDKKLGRLTAELKFLKRNWIRLRLPLKGHYSRQLRILLSGLILPKQAMIESLLEDDAEREDNVELSDYPDIGGIGE